MEIRFENLSYDILDEKIIDNVNLSIHSGKINTFIGANGSGKSSILNLISLNILPTKGKIVINENEFTTEIKSKNVNKIKKKIGYLIQTPEEKFYKKTVRYHLLDILEQYNYSIDIKNKKINDAMLMIGLESPYLDRDPYTLSNAEKRKLAIISVLIHNPKIIIFDEPTAFLDNKSKNDILKIIKKLSIRYHKTIIIASNDIDSMHKIADNIFVIEKGKIVMQGEKYTIFSKEEQLQKMKINVPKIMSFSNEVLKDKKIKIGCRDDINDLIKDIYRFVK